MTLWTSLEIREAIGGIVPGNWKVDGVSIDTRTLEKGDLFVALTDKRDGHDFVKKAFENGACAAIVSHIPDGLADDPRLILVSDVLEALRSLARASRARFSGKLIAITGSVGKTSTKEMLRVALISQGTVHASDKSFNNHWGVPLTLARMPSNTEFAIVEMGMNRSGEIREHSRLSKPHVALITSVKSAHMSNFRNLRDIAMAKSEIFDGLEDEGTAIVNSDIKNISVVEKAVNNKSARLVKFGVKGPDWVFDELIINGTSINVRVRKESKKFKFTLNSLGEHFALNGLATIAAVDSVGADINIAIGQLESWFPLRGRGQHIEVKHKKEESNLCFDIIDDSYNSNPTSLKAGLKLLNKLYESKHFLRQLKGKKIAILGDMLELGSDEILIHRGIATWDELEGIKSFYLVGDLMKHLFDCLPSNVNKFWFQSSNELIKIISETITSGDVILIKGSQSLKMAEVVSRLTNIANLPKSERS